MARFKFADITKAIDLIKEFEGLYLKPYKDPVGIPTIGWGTIRYPNGKAVTMSDPAITQAQAQAYLEHDIQETFDKVDGMVKYNVNANMFGALVSFAYNVGWPSLQSSTLLKKLNAGDVVGASEEFARWNKGTINGVKKELAGLTRRRKAERDLFLTAVDAPITEPITEMEQAEKELGAEAIETPSWFEPFKKWIMALVDAIFGKEKKGESGIIPDDADTGVIATVTLSEGSGPRITLERVKEILKANAIDLTKPCLLGIRGYYLDTYGVKGQNDRGVYDDALIWFNVDTFRTFRGNTDPSSYRKGSGTGSSKGMANLLKGIWKGYYPGMHNGSVPHLAFRQGQKVTVMRDGTPSYPDTGLFGINIHRGGVNSTSSLGCQTIMQADWNTFKAYGDAALKKYGMSSFTYVLVEELDLRAGKLKVS